MRMLLALWAVTGVCGGQEQGGGGAGTGFGVAAAAGVTCVSGQEQAAGRGSREGRQAGSSVSVCVRGGAG